jgi:hypothetical protein
MMNNAQVRGTPRIAKREDCEMIMMVGLPASGKSTWYVILFSLNSVANYDAGQYCGSGSI